MLINKKYLKNITLSGNEIVASTRRLALMNMFLHNIGELTGESMISSNDSLIADTGIRFDYVPARRFDKNYYPIRYYIPFYVCRQEFSTSQVLKLM
jgi:type I restriction-modification system DNA methylase subunit